MSQGHILKTTEVSLDLLSSVDSVDANLGVGKLKEPHPSEPEVELAAGADELVVVGVPETLIMLHADVPELDLFLSNHVLDPFEPPIAAAELEMERALDRGRRLPKHLDELLAEPLEVPDEHAVDVVLDPVVVGPDPAPEADLLGSVVLEQLSNVAFGRAKDPSARTVETKPEPDATDREPVIE